jgi:poly-gamma-glutamate capsule biosynthesis protein CapA/YwtB (metallophosphatase superfamily)
MLQEQPGDPPKIRTRVEADDEERICQNIRQARKRVDHVVVGIHWGVAFAKQLAEYQQPLGRKMIEAGASLVVGHHSHIRHGIECYKNGVILYSLGDFVFHDRVDMTGESGMIATIEFQKNKIVGLRLWPLKLDSKLGLPILGSGKETKKFLEEMKHLSPSERFSLDGEAVKVRT